MKEKIISYWQYIVGIVLALACIFAFLWFQRQNQLPRVNEDGDINGVYSVSDIMRLGKAYLCLVNKSDENSKIEGGIFTDSKNIYGEFDIQMGTSTEAKIFSSYLLVKDGRAYTWTSLANVGNISKPADSAIHGKSVAEQAQIVGKDDELDLKCRWQKKGINDSFFEIPGDITFTELK